MLAAVLLSFVFGVPGRCPAATRVLLPRVEAVDPECRQLANRILTEVLEAEGLYTVVGGLKPMSSVSLQSYSREAKVDAAELRRRYEPAARALCDEHTTYRMRFNDRGTPRWAEAWVFQHNLIRAKIREHAAILAHERLSAGMPMEVLVDRVLRYDFRDPDQVIGLLYGFPEHAVDFFCHPQKYGADHDVSPVGTDRRGIRIPTYREGGYFVYVVPMRAEATDTDVHLISSAWPILTEYRRRRALHLTGETVDAVGLLREWIREIGGEVSTGVPRWSPEPPKRRPATAEDRGWRDSWTGSWTATSPQSHSAVITDDGAAHGLRFVLYGGNQYFEFRLVPAGEAGEVRLEPVTSYNSHHDEASFVIENTGAGRWRVKSRFNQRSQEARERSAKQRNQPAPPPLDPKTTFTWGEFRRAPTVREAMEHGQREQWARVPTPAQGTPAPSTSGRDARSETRPTGFDPRWHEFPLYLREFGAAVRHRMYVRLLDSEVRPPRATRCSLRFSLNAQGEISDIVEVGHFYGEAAAVIARGALQGAFRPWTPEMIARLGGTQAFTFQFYFEY